MATNNNNNQTLIPNAKQALNQMKYEIASQINVNLKQGYNGDITSREAGSIGGNMVKKMIAAYEQNMAGNAGGTTGIGSTGSMGNMMK